MRGYGRDRGVTEMAPTADYDGRFAFMRLRYGRPSGGFSIREPGRTTSRARIFIS